MTRIPACLISFFSFFSFSHVKCTALKKLQPFRGGSRKKRTRSDPMSRTYTRVAKNNDHPRGRHQHKILRSAWRRSSTLASASASSARSRAHSFQDVRAAALVDARICSELACCARLSITAPSRRGAAGHGQPAAEAQRAAAEQQKSRAAALAFLGSAGWVCQCE